MENYKEKMDDVIKLSNKIHIDICDVSYSESLFDENFKKIYKNVRKLASLLFNKMGWELYDK